MTTQANTDQRVRTQDREARTGEGPARAQLLAGIPASESRFELAGISTAVLEGGDGPPIVLLHGPGEFAAKWLRVLPDLTSTNAVVAPDLPAHGATDAPDGELDAERMNAWLGELIERTCPTPPVLVGHVLGGAIAARFAVDHGDRIRSLVLVDTLGLARFRPKPRFALTMAGFLARPTERSYDRFMRQCSLDLDGLREQMGERWDPFVSYNLQLASSPKGKLAGRLMRRMGLPRIPAGDLARIEVPTALIWGRQDRANRLRIAEDAATRYGWLLEVVETCADDPARDQPEAFVRALRATIEAGQGSG